jgi:K(+)-stimulated pyrophosphate-energized sodium pump
LIASVGSNLLPSQGGFQQFVLGTPERLWLVFALLAGVVALGVALYLMRGVLHADQGTASMREIALAIQEGAVAFLRRQFRTILIIIVPLFVLVFFTATKVVRPDHTIALSFTEAGLARAVAFLVGATFSGTTGFIGMSLAVRGNVRTAAAARDGSLPSALRVAFRTGGITGMFCVGLGLIGATAIVFIFQQSATAVLVGFGFGASLLALFMRVGGGIFTKAADVGADLVGKVEAGIPEDDPRNAATIGDNVGDNVGDCAGMAADLFESYEITIIASLILGYSAFRSIHLNPARGLIYPLVIAGIGILTSAIGILSVRARNKDRSAMAPINRAFRSSAVLTLIGAFLVAQFYIHNLKVFWAVLTGVGTPLTQTFWKPRTSSTLMVGPGAERVCVTRVFPEK